MENSYFQIRSWKKYQSFNKDRPNWIKLHSSLLDDYDYCTLADTNKILFVHLCVLAGQLHNRIPSDKKWLSKKLSLRRIDLAGLSKAGFIEPYNNGDTDVTQALHSRGRDREETEKTPLPPQAGDSENGIETPPPNSRAAGTSPRQIAGKKAEEEKQQRELEAKIDKEVDDAWAAANAIPLSEWRRRQQDEVVI